MDTSNFTFKGRRVVVIQWKENRDHPVEVFSNLKNFCTSYPRFNYNTLNNYLSKNKIAFENDKVRIERKNIISTVKPPASREQSPGIIRVVRKSLIKEINQDIEDMEYWLAKTVRERAAAVTSIISQSLKKGQRLDKSYLLRRSL